MIEVLGKIFLFFNIFICMEQKLKNEYGETEYFKYGQARSICNKYQYLVGKEFDTPFGMEKIDYVMPVRMSNGLFVPMIVHDVYLAPSIPENYNYKNPANYLLSYLKHNNIPLHK